MEIHRPKRWHGWREFLREYAIIFVGVLTALAFEQAAEWLHRRGELEEVRRAVRSEIAANAAIAGGVVAQEHCLVALANRIGAWANGDQGPGYPQRSPSIWMPRTTTWEVVRAGAAARMPVHELLAYAEFYELVEADQVRANLEIDIWQDLVQVAGQSGSSGSLNGSEVRQLAGLTNRLRLLATIRERNARDLVDQASSLGVKAAPMSPLQREDLSLTCSFARAVTNPPRAAGP